MNREKLTSESHVDIERGVYLTIILITLLLIMGGLTLTQDNQTQPTNNTNQSDLTCIPVDNETVCWTDENKSKVGLQMILRDNDNT